MQDRWVGRKVDLKSLSEYVRQFFERKNFHSAVEEKSSNEHRVIGVPDRAFSNTSIMESVNVVIRGKPNDFVIEFVAGSSSRLFTKLGGLTMLFGGGHFLLRGLKSSEELETLEKEFWRFVEETIDHLDKSSHE